MIVIPMVGKSSRFFKAGYQEPKYKLTIGAVTVFEKAVSSFSRYFDTDPFLFLVRGDYDAFEFVNIHARKLGIKNFKVVEFKEETLGQADTVYQGLVKSINFAPPEEPIYIFNIDTFHLNFSKSQSKCDGYLEVFEGDGEHWSFVAPGVEDNVARTTEKERISNLCSNGLYYFRNAEIFFSAFRKMVDINLKPNGEFYIAPMYNMLIADNLTVKYKLVNLSDLVFCGTPAEYDEALLAYKTQNS
ncbi:capsular biosynthesis protein [Pseudomonas fulva]|uniref:capsular biosynthesis protein n=1 Tax=Pseudomonas fulva TaxID=47880 RepID=UPI003EEB05A9